MKINIKWKVSPIIMLGFLLLAAALLYIYIKEMEIHFSQDNISDIREAKGSFDNIEQEEIKVLKAGLTGIMESESVKNTFLTKDRAKLYEVTKGMFQQLNHEIGLTHWLFHEPDKNVLLRVHNPESFGKPIKDRLVLEKAINSNSWGTGLELGNTGFALRVVHPYYQNDKLIGYMEFGEEATPFISMLKKETGNDFIMAVKKTDIDPLLWADTRKTMGLENNYNDLEDYLAVAATDEKFIKNANCYNDTVLDNVSEGGSIFSKFTSGADTYICGGFTLRDVSKNKIGAIVTVKKITIDEGRFAETRLMGIYLSIVITFIISLTIIYLIGNIIVNPLTSLVATINLIGKGNLDARVKIKTNDEMGEVGRQFNEMTKKLDDTQKELSAYSENLEEKVGLRTEELKKNILELEKFQSLTIDREIKMVELKKKISKLEKELKDRLQTTE